MSRSKKKHGLGRTAASGLVFDPELRRAVLQATPPVARLGYTLGKRMASQQLDEAGEAFSHLSSLLTSAGPRLAEQLGRAEPEPPRRRLLPAAGGIALVALTVVLATDPARRRRLQRLVVH